MYVPILLLKKQGDVPVSSGGRVAPRKRTGDHANTALGRSGITLAWNMTTGSCLVSGPQVRTVPEVRSTPRWGTQRQRGFRNQTLLLDGLGLPGWLFRTCYKYIYIHPHTHAHACTREAQGHGGGTSVHASEVSGFFLVVGKPTFVMMYVYIASVLAGRIPSHPPTKTQGDPTPS